MSNSRLLVWFGLITFFATLIFGWQKMRQNVDINAATAFDLLVKTERDLLVTRTEDYERVLRGSLGLFSASAEVNRSEWHAYYRALELDKSLPGIQGLGYSVIFPKSEMQALVDQVRAEGYPEFSVYPDTERPIYSAIIFIEPFLARNLKAFGYDMYSEPVRREAMDRAIVTAMPSWSGKVTLVQENDSDVQAGFLVYLPVYHKGYPTRSEFERKKAIQGFVYSAFRAGDLMSQLFDYPDRLFEVQLYDKKISAENLLYSSTSNQEPIQNTTLSEAIEINIGGATWIALFTSNQRFDESQSYSLANLFLTAGLIVLLVLLISLALDERQRKQLSSANLSLKSRIDESIVMAELTGLLQSCTDVDEAFPIISSSMRTLLPNLSGACYILNNSETLLIAKCHWNGSLSTRLSDGSSERATTGVSTEATSSTTFRSSTPGSLTETFEPQACWAVKRSLIHLSGNGTFAEVRCNHLQGANEAICAPLLTQGKLIGVLSFVAASAADQNPSLSNREKDLITSASEIISLSLANLILRVSLRDLSMKDSLTGLYNRRFMEESIDREIERARRNGSSLAVAMIDLDHFKSINDSYGHSAGDQVLKTIAGVLNRFRTGSDYVARYGGEEFLLVLTDISSDEAAIRLEQLRHAVEESKIESEGHLIENVTISVGVAIYPEVGQDQQTLIGRSDQALYKAKEKGRNQVVFCSKERPLG